MRTRATTASSDGEENGRRCWIAPAGLELLARLQSAMQEGARGFMAPLSEADLASFVRLLDALRAGPSAPRLESHVAVAGTGRAPVPQNKEMK